MERVSIPLKMQEGNRRGLTSSNKDDIVVLKRE